MTRLTERDEKMLRMCCEMDVQLVAQRLGVKTSTIYSRLAWLRKKKEENRKFVNMLLNYEKMCSKLKKLLTIGKR